MPVVTESGSLTTLVAVVTEPSGTELHPRLLLLHVPVVLPVVLDSLDFGQRAKLGLDLLIVRRLVHLHALGVVEVGGELGRQTLAQPLGRRRELRLLHGGERLVLVLGLDALPRQVAAQQVQPDVGERLHVVARAQLLAAVRVQAGVARRADHRVGEVVAGAAAQRPSALVLLRQAEVDDVDVPRVGADPDEEVVRFDIAVDEVLLVDEAHDVDHLVGEHQHGLQREAVVAVGEQVLDARAEQLDDEHVVERLVVVEAAPEELRDAGSALQVPVDVGLGQQLRTRRLLLLQLHDDVLARLQHHAAVDRAERAAVDQLEHARLHAAPDDEVRGRRAARRCRRRLVAAGLGVVTRRVRRADVDGRRRSRLHGHRYL